MGDMRGDDPSGSRAERMVGRRGAVVEGRAVVRRNAAAHDAGTAAGGRPKPVRWTNDRRAVFAQELAASGNVVAAAAAAGMSPTSAYALRRADPAFAAAWSDAREQFADTAEARAISLALEGLQEETEHNGEYKRTKRHSDKLISALLTARRAPAAAASAGAPMPGKAGEEARLEIERRLAAIAARLGRDGR